MQYPFQEGGSWRRSQVEQLHHIPSPKYRIKAKCPEQSLNVRFRLWPDAIRELNVLFCTLNILFWRFNVLFSQDAADVQTAVPKLIFLPQEEIPEKQLQIFCRCADAADVVVVIGPNQRVAEIPGIPGENVVGDIKAQRPQVLDEENSGRAGIALAEGMDLP